MKSLISWLMRTVPRPWLIRLSYLFNKISPVLLKGNKVECPICGGRFKYFLPYGAIKRRDNVLCPSCLSLERHRLLWLFLKQKTDFFTRSQRLLHIAPEQCFYHRFKAQKNLEVVTADLNSPLADVKMDIHKMPFGDEEFDVVLCNHVLEHVDDPDVSMKEIYRVLKPGGWAVMQVPIDSSRETTYEDPAIVTEADRELHYWQKDHVRLFGRDYPKRIESNGFTVNVFKVPDLADAEKAVRYSLMAGEEIYQAMKP